MISTEGRPQWWSMTITRAALRLIPAGGARVATPQVCRACSVRLSP